MSGRTFYKQENLLNIFSRRAFLLKAGIITSGILLSGCLKKIKSNAAYKNIKGSLKGPNAKAGHVLRDKMPLATPSSIRSVRTLIIGSGISGLSAARWLKKNGEHDFEILELENHIGGNAHSGKNAISSYPLAAHYVTIANNDDQYLIDFFKDAGVITGFENNLPVYNEFHLCFDPEERLLINGEWQDGIIPEFGISDEDRKQIKRFFSLVNTLKQTKGEDEKFIFNIPLNESSSDESYIKLDQLSFKNYLTNEGFTSAYLLWYLDYCCKDDYGQQIDKVSAWAGLHYFASRRGKAANAEGNAILTWPEGNAWLMKQLAKGLEKNITKNAMCYRLSQLPKGGISANILNTVTNETYTIRAEKIILATPQFINQKILGDEFSRKLNLDLFQYAPWFVANITVNHLPQGKGAGLAWDNVAYDMPSVGYVNANQQHVNVSENKKVITYYLPLCKQEPRIARLAAYTRTWEQWLDIIIPELEFMHPGITEFIDHVEGWVWGHGMISPSVNYIWGEERKKAASPIDDVIFFAHSDLSGVSIFEEAFHQGIKAASDILSGYGKRTDN